MVRFVHRYEALVRDAGSAPHLVFACAGQRSDGAWEGWLVFVPLGRGATVATGRETTQSSLEAIRYWAGGLSTVYLEGALARASQREHRAAPGIARLARSSTARGRDRPSPLSRSRLSAPQRTLLR